MSNSITLKANRIIYFSEYDEAIFFEWLNKINCVMNYEGEGDNLYIHVDSSLVDQYMLREFLALFYRYDIDMKQLRIFDSEEFKEWFRGKEKYWFNKVFAVNEENSA